MQRDTGRVGGFGPLLKDGVTLLSAAGTRRFEHTVAQLREERASAEAKAQAAQAYTDKAAGRR
ncbi:hypothetical protein MPRS_18790 [Mycobacterium paraseoulense]|nr:hypothetical protein MPRS_18790 [Mycobacterium paraseoulense]